MCQNTLETNSKQCTSQPHRCTLQSHPKSWAPLPHHVSKQSLVKKKAAAVLQLTSVLAVLGQTLAPSSCNIINCTSPRKFPLKSFTISASKMIEVEPSQLSCRLYYLLTQQMCYLQHLPHIDTHWWVSNPGQNVKGCVPKLTLSVLLPTNIFTVLLLVVYISSSFSHLCSPVKVSFLVTSYTESRGKGA